MEVRLMATIKGVVHYAPSDIRVEQVAMPENGTNSRASLKPSARKLTAFPRVNDCDGDFRILR
jgi:hypothetical protein